MQMVTRSYTLHAYGECGVCLCVCVCVQSQCRLICSGSVRLHCFFSSLLRTLRRVATGVAAATSVWCYSIWLTTLGILLSIERHSGPGVSASTSACNSNGSFFSLSVRSFTICTREREYDERKHIVSNIYTHSHVQIYLIDIHFCML